MSTVSIPKIDYDNPPVVEVAISIQFDPPKGLNQAHLGAFWASNRDEYPSVTTAQSIPVTHEHFGRTARFLPSQMAFTFDATNPDCRIQMVSSNEEWMCQIQRDRLVVNWRKKKADYPRYEQTSEKFKFALLNWLTFVKSVNPTAASHARSWEVVYINRIEAANWTTVNDWPKITPGLFAGPYSDVPGATLTGMNSQWIWESSNPPVRLYVEPKPMRRLSPEGEVHAYLNFIARGPLGKDPRGIDIFSDDAWQQISPAIESGRNLIVQTFDSLISDQAKNYWRQRVN